MISLELSTIQHKNTERAWLNAGIESFLAAGGKVVVAPILIGQPSPTPLSTKAAEAAPPALRQPAADPARDARRALVKRLRELSATLTAREAAEATGISRRTACAYAKANRFSFQPGQKYAIAANIQRHSSPAQDAKDAERLRAFCSIGVTLSQAAKHMGYGRCRVQRLADQFGIEFVRRRRPKP